MNLNFKKRGSLLLALLLGSSVVSCSDDKKQEQELPVAEASLLEKIERREFTTLSSQYNLPICISFRKQSVHYVTDEGKYYVCKIVSDDTFGTWTEISLNDGVSSLIEVSNVTACPNGGSKFKFGMDANYNNVIDAGELKGETEVCNGVDGTNGSNGLNGTNGIDGLTTLVNTEVLPVNGVCLNGGTKVLIGLDDNANGVLDVAEVNSTHNICNGVDGADGMQGIQGEIGPQGPQGPQGPAGTDGTNGTDGADGANGADGASCSVSKDDVLGTITVDCGVGGSEVLNDFDADGYGNIVDCNDNDAMINPGMTEVLNDNIDNDCNGVVDPTNIADFPCNKAVADAWPIESATYIFNDDCTVNPWKCALVGTPYDAAATGLIGKLNGNCKALCEADANCTAVLQDNSGGTCYLHSDLTIWPLQYELYDLANPPFQRFSATRICR